MQLFTDCHQDLRLLDLRGLAPLRPDMAGAEMDLAAMIEGHNTRCARAAARLRQLAEDRRRLGDFGAWEHKDSKSLLAERARLRGATWDALLELRHTLEERQDVLQQIELRLRERYDEADRQHDQAVEGAERRLAKERRRFERANPATARSNFAELVEDDESVQEAAKRLSTADDVLNNIAEAKRGVMVDRGTVTARQREVFRAMVV